MKFCCTSFGLEMAVFLDICTTSGQSKYATVSFKTWLAPCPISTVKVDHLCGQKRSVAGGKTLINLRMLLEINLLPKMKLTISMYTLSLSSSRFYTSVSVPLGVSKMLKGLCCNYMFWNIPTVTLHPLVTASLNPASIPQYSPQNVSHLVHTDYTKFSKMLY